MATTSSLLRVKLLDAPRFIYRSGTDSVYIFRASFLRFRESGESVNRIEDDYREHLILNWVGRAPRILIYGDSPDSDTRAKAALVLGIASSRISDDGIGRSASLIDEVVECRIRSGSLKALRETALATLLKAFGIMVRSTYRTDGRFSRSPHQRLNQTEYGEIL